LAQANGAILPARDGTRFGGLAKGHAAKRVARLVQKQGIAAALVSLGGSSLCASEVIPSATAPRFRCNETGVALGEWPIGVIPRATQRNAPCISYSSQDGSFYFGTSERQFEPEGKC